MSNYRNVHARADTWAGPVCRAIRPNPIVRGEFNPGSGLRFVTVPVFSNPGCESGNTYIVADDVKHANCQRCLAVLQKRKKKIDPLIDVPSRFERAPVF